MKLNSQQLLSIVGFSILLLVLLFGFRTKPKDLIDLEKSRALNLESTNAAILIQEAGESISGDDKARIQILEAKISESSDTEKAELLKELSSVWYGIGETGIAGHYAQEVAEIEQTANAWGITGTTYAICVKRSAKEKERSFCLSRALEAMENAISLDPENIDYRLNKAVILAENPPSENPMAGVQQLLNLNKNFPKNVPVINNIARFALQTNQLERAEQRLLGALEIEPDNSTTNCLLTQLYLAKGDENEAAKYQEKCGN